MLRAAALVVVLTLFSFDVHASHTMELKLFDFEKQIPPSCDLKDPYCMTTHHLVEHAIRHNYDSREKIETLFKIRNRSKELIGLLLPHVNSASAYRMVEFDFSEAASCFVGFLFPNRWLDWQENRRLKDAEIESYRTLLANRANAIQDIYYSIQTQLWSMEVYKHYVQLLQKVIEVLKFQHDTKRRVVCDAHINVIENIVARLTYDLAEINTVPATIALMSQTVGLSFQRQWTKLKFIPTHFHPLINETNWHDTVEALDQVFPSCLLKKKEDPNYSPEQSCLKETLAKSTELKTLDYLIEAAIAGKKSNYFDFFDPRSHNDLGYGFGPRIKIHKADIEILKIQRDKTRAQIYTDIALAYNNYVRGLDRYDASERGMEHLEGLRKRVEEIINDPRIPFDINEFVRFYEFSVEADIHHILSFFEVRAAQASFNRHTWNGPLYKIVRNYVDTDMEKDYKKIEKKHRLKKLNILWDTIRNHRYEKRGLPIPNWEYRNPDMQDLNQDHVEK